MSNDIQFSVKKGSRFAGLNGALLRGPRKATRRVSFRVPDILLGNVRRLAIEHEMPITDLCAVLIHITSIANFLRLEKQEVLNSFLSSVKLSRGLKVLGGHRPRIGTQGVAPVSWRFPARFLETLGLYASLTGRSRSDLLVQFLEQGIRIYMRSWVAVTKALTTALTTVNIQDTMRGDSTGD